MKNLTLFVVAAAVSMAGCQNNAEQQAEAQENSRTDQEMPVSETENEWKSLFNGENLEGWKAYNHDEITKWSVEDSALVFLPEQGDRTGSENIITEDTYTSFELSLEWKISEGGNSGIMWAVQENQQFGEPYVTGPEIQILDNERHPDAANGPILQAGSLYDLVEPNEDNTRPAGQWNEMTITVDYDQNQGFVTMNGNRITEFPLHGEKWEALVEDSKFADWEEFAKSRSGHIALQDHGDKVWYKNIKIRELN